MENTNRPTKVIPLFTIITVCLNSKLSIEKTLQSVQQQTFDNFELLIIDGGSTDGTQKVFNKYSDIVSYSDSAADNGISHAMNKGLAIAQGEFVFFLHADDCFSNENSLKTVASCINSCPDSNVYTFDITFGLNNPVRYRPRGFNFWLNLKTGFYHQATFCRRSLFQNVGIFNEDYKIAMDYDWFLRAYRSGETENYFPEIISIMGESGISSQRDWPSVKNRLQEEKIIHFRHSKNILWKAVYFLWWSFYPTYKKYMC